LLGYSGSSERRYVERIDLASGAAAECPDEGTLEPSCDPETGIAINVAALTRGAPDPFADGGDGAAAEGCVGLRIFECSMLFCFYFFFFFFFFFFANALFLLSFFPSSPQRTSD
jgi:hypothetical protein